MKMKNLVIALTIGAAVAGGVVATSAPAIAGGVQCDNQEHQAGAGGRAWADRCDHRGNHNVRLYAECDWSPAASYSSWRKGDFDNVDFATETCTFGVESSGFQH